MIYTAMTMKALNVAYNAHQGQMDRHGAPYIFHPFHLAEQMEDEITCTTALLHDVVEKTNMTIEDLKIVFPEIVTDTVALLTPEPGLDFFEYIKRIKTNRYAAKVKLADLLHDSDESRTSAGLPVNEKELRKQLLKYEKAIGMLRR